MSELCIVAPIYIYIITLYYTANNFMVYIYYNLYSRNNFALYSFLFFIFKALPNEMIFFRRIM